MVACGMTAYVGICVGYVGLVHLRLVSPDKKKWTSPSKCIDSYSSGPTKYPVNNENNIW
jgi:hypothetical protein